MLAGVATGALYLFAPQVPVLWREGFPAPVWPAAGQFHPVPRGNAAPLPVGAPLPANAQALFDGSGGRALLVWKDGALAYEAYGLGIDRETRLNSYSMVKTLIGALVLRAHAKGQIASLDAPLSDYLTGPVPNATLRQVLTMTSGLDMAYDPAKPVDDGDFSPFGPLGRLHAFGLEAILGDLDVDPQAQGHFRYQSANTAILGAVLEQATGTPLPDLLSHEIWRPAGAAPAQWRVAPEGSGVSAYCCLYARPVDWLRVGRFLLHNGTGSGAPFLPPALWRDFLLPPLDPAKRRAGAYGMHIRHDVLDRQGEPAQGPFAYAMGHAGQVLYFVPGQDAVVVRFGERPQLLHSTLYDVLR